MARTYEPTEEQISGYNEWVESRPEIIKKVARKLVPWELYQYGDHKVVVYSFHEDGTITVVVSGEYNKVLFGRRVFGVNPDELVPCELPGPDEPVGSALTPEEVEENMDVLRVAIRPDLWELKNGEAVRKDDNQGA